MNCNIQRWKRQLHCVSRILVHGISQFKGHIYLNEKPFFQISSVFPSILGFWGHFWGSQAKSSDFQKLRLYLLLYSKRPSRSHSFNAKIGLKSGPLWAVIFEKKTIWGCGLVWCAMLKKSFANFSAHCGPIFKPIFALKPWDRDGRFEYNKRYKRCF